jgi:bromodomain adjacent to zinc finger domain protein 1B
MLIFENSITWNKSTLGIKCKICRKKHKDECIIVCDQCCYGFHQECLHDYSEKNKKNSTNDLWYCPACRPSTKRRARQEKTKIDYQENDIYDDMNDETDSNTSSQERNNDQLSDSDDDIQDEDAVCNICGGENDLIQCTQCQTYYHCQCHEPPLRCPPRSTTWICNNCRNGITNETNRSKTNKKIKKTQQKKRIQTQKQNNTRRSKILRCLNRLSCKQT